jgi:hypothetical protein
MFIERELAPQNSVRRSGIHVELHHAALVLLRTVEGVWFTVAINMSPLRGEIRTEEVILILLLASS